MSSLLINTLFMFSKLLFGYLLSNNFVKYGSLPGQYIYDAVNKWRIRKAMQIHYPELFENKRVRHLS